MLLLVGLALLVRVAPRERRGALVAGSLAAAVVLAPVVLALVGTDYLIARNTIVAVVPAAVCVGAGYATGRLGLAAAAALCVLSAAIALAPALDATYGRTDWRGAAARLDDDRRPAGDRRHAVHEPDALAAVPARSRGAVVRRGDRAGDRRDRPGDGGWLLGGRDRPARGRRSEPVPGFRVVEVERAPTYTLVRYRSDRPRRVPLSTLTGLALTDEQPGVLLQHDGVRADDAASIPE